MLIRKLYPEPKFASYLSVGQAIKLEDGYTGVVVRIGTRIHTGNPGSGQPNHVVVEIETDDSYGSADRDQEDAEWQAYRNG